MKVVRGEIGDPTLSFQLKGGFEVIAVVSNYLRRRSGEPRPRGCHRVAEPGNRDAGRCGAASEVPVERDKITPSGRPHACRASQLS